MSLIMASIIWLPNAARFFDQPQTNYYSQSGIPDKAREIAERQIKIWTDPVLRQHELDKMRNRNAEWDFMARCFLVWSLGNIGLREPAMISRITPVLDSIINETIRLEHEHGIHFFLMPYSRTRDFKLQPERSIFIDGEIALMLGLRRMLAENPAYRAMHLERVELMLQRMQQSQVLCGESYPDECWMFCNCVALAAIKTSDYLDSTDHSDFFREWVSRAKDRLTCKKNRIAELVVQSGSNKLF
jgi:hypothetical protein